MSVSRQLVMERPEVNFVNRSVNVLRCVREAREICRMKQGAMALEMGISEPLLSAQLSDHEPTKHLSVRRLMKITDPVFWREFALLILEDLGLSVVVVSPEERAAVEGVRDAWHRYVASHR